MKNVQKVFSEILTEISPSDLEMKEMNSIIKSFVNDIKEKIKKNNLEIQLFLGGSFAKRTVTKKDSYDADVFLRFDKKYSQKEYSEKIEKLLEEKNYEKVHGSRDYFRVQLKENFFIEIIPVKKISKPEDAENITDLSYSHVKYLNKKIKDKKILNEIKIAKAFCFAKKVYGAESYIRGFSGYGLELLVYYYKSFEKMMKELSKEKKEKIIIDIENSYKNKKRILLDINESKLEAPIVLIDPTYKTRNVLAALSEDSFERFKKAAKRFLKNPSKKDFIFEKIDFSVAEKETKKGNLDLLKIRIKTNKQKGDVAGTKLLKFYNHFREEVSKYFKIKKTDFEYNQNQEGLFFILAEPKSEIILDGPLVVDKKNCLEFRKAHKNVFEKKGKLFSKKKIDFDLKEFSAKWKKENKRKIEEMYLDEFKIIYS